MIQTMDHGVYLLNGREILTGGSTPIVYFAQSDAQWRDRKYGSASIGD